MRKKTFKTEEEIIQLVSTVEGGNLSKCYGFSIDKLREFLKHPISISDALKEGSYKERMDVAYDIATLSMALAVKYLVPRENFKDIIVRMVPGVLETNRGELCGTNEKKDGKTISSMYLNAIQKITFGEIDFLGNSLGTFAHELRHAMQSINSQNKNCLTISNLIYCLERIAHDDDYHENYNTIYFETEAFYTGCEFASHLISILLKKKDIKERFIELMMLMLNRQNWKNVLFDFDTQCDIVKKLLEIIKEKKIVITEELFEEYPILRVVYDRNGNRYDSDTYINFLLKNQDSESAGDLCKLLLRVTQEAPREIKRYA